MIEKIESKNQFFVSPDVKDAIINDRHLKMTNTNLIVISTDNKKHLVKNDFISSLFIIINGEQYNKDLKIEVLPKNKALTPDDDYKENALQSLKTIFISGNKAGNEYFNNNYKSLFENLFITNTDKCIEVFNDYYHNLKVGFNGESELGKHTFKEYQYNRPLIFDEASFYKYGFINGLYISFIEFMERYPYLKNAVNDKAKKTPHQESKKQRFKKVEKQFFVIAELLATNEVEIKENGQREYKFNNTTYFEATKVNKAINKKYNINYKFNQYLTGFNLNKDKDLLSLKEQNNLTNYTNLQRLKKIRCYFNKYNIEIVNEDFKEVFRQLDETK